MIHPPSLKRGDTIGITCPAGYMPREKAQACITTLMDWGYEVMIGNTLGSSSNNYFSGSDDERLEELQAMMDNKDINAILFARGGYGMGRIIDRINFKRFIKNPKWVIGFSDITVMHCHLLAKYKIASLHAPMAAAFNDEEPENPFTRSLRDALSGKKAAYNTIPHPYNILGKAKGILTGGNLSLFVNMIGTTSEIDTDGTILFLEDIGEYLYNVDRMLWQLKRSGKLKKLKGLILGGFTDMKDTERPFGKQMDEILQEVVGDAAYPVCYHFPVSHERENYALKIGIKYKLSVSSELVLLEEGRLS
jgi:muramoyltetrapeptide carboxypeptidase